MTVIDDLRQKYMRLPVGKCREVWYRFVSPNQMCGLCGQSGIIDTRGKLFTPAGVECGVRVTCICPNGQSLEKQRYKL